MKFIKIFLKIIYFSAFKAHLLLEKSFENSKKTLKLSSNEKKLRESSSNSSTHIGTLLSKNAIFLSKSIIK